jgi:hypothetical protein
VVAGSIVVVSGFVVGLVFLVVPVLGSVVLVVSIVSVVVTSAKFRVRFYINSCHLCNWILLLILKEEKGGAQ